MTVIKQLTELKKRQDISIGEVIDALDLIQPETDVVGISPGFIDKMSAHELADQFLLCALRAAGQQDVVEAYLALQKRFDGFWYG